tara:strand:- start:1806 stop:2249 length:444 start_codon:yes stop_codon:yes gene_type:complete
MKLFTHITGDKELDAMLIKVSEAYKVKALRQVLRKAATPVVKAVRANTPVSDRDDFDTKHKVGDLKKSIGKITGKSKDFPTIYVGPRVKRKWGIKGYIGGWVEDGVNSSVVNFDGRRYMKKGYESSRGQATMAIRNSLIKILQKHLK